MADPNMNHDNIEERIVMTPTKKTPKSTTIRMERLKQPEISSGSVMHIAGGDHKGIVINKEASSNDVDSSLPELFLEFKVFLVNQQTSTQTQEKRQLRFWFKPEIDDMEQMRTAQDFFKELVSPMEFPRDYVGFIKKIMKLMQVRYPQLRKVEVELSQLEEMEKMPSRPTTAGNILITVGCPWEDQVSLDDSVLLAKVEVTPAKVLEMIESAYPNPLSVADMAKQTLSEEEEVHIHVTDLESKGLVRPIENGHLVSRSYVRIAQNETEVKIVKQMPAVVSHQQPTIAIITAQYCEKLAVDAMIENKDTYVRYTTVGESNVYTLGNIGSHRVVSTKLPTVGHTRAAMIAAGNTTTRLLGCFQKVDHVFLVGVGGGIPHYTDHSRHVRMGDIVVSSPAEGKKYVYAYCDNALLNQDNSFIFECKTWQPTDLILQEVAHRLVESEAEKLAKSRHECKTSWDALVEEGLKELAGQAADFSRPPVDTDRLFMSLGGKDMIELAHPVTPESCHSSLQRREGLPKVHFGAVGSGRHVVRDDAARQEFASQLGVLAMDNEFDAVVESIFGNRKDSYIFIRGIADYRDGTRRKEWQPHAALLAAAFMKAVICEMPTPQYMYECYNKN